MSARIRVAVIGGGQNCEHDVSLASAASVVASLPQARFEPVPLTISREGVWSGPDAVPLGSTRASSFAAAVLLLAGCDVVLPMVHGPLGEDGTLAAVCELVGVPHAGSGVRAGAIAMDKWATKAVARAAGIRVAPGLQLASGAPYPTDVPMPAVVKPVAAGSSHGVHLVDRMDDLAAALDDAFRFDSAVLVEGFITGREVDVAVLRRADGEIVASPPLEILLDAGTVFDTDGKYDGTARFQVPARLTDDERRAVQDAAVRLFAEIGCDGVARIDFFLTADGPVLNEVNTTPGFTAASQVPRMFAAAHLPYPALLADLVDGALHRRAADGALL